jgi:putative copper export protein
MEWVLARWITFGATLLVIGTCTVAVTILPRAGHDRGARATLLRDSARFGFVASLLLIPSGALRLADQLQALQSPGDPVFSGLRALLFTTTWGTGFLCQMVAALSAMTGLLWAIGNPTARRWWSLAIVGMIGLAVTPSMQGHAIGSEQFTAIAVMTDVAHVFGAGVWIGSIAVIGWLGLSIRNESGAFDAARGALADVRLRLLVPLIPPVALSGAAALIGSGVLAAVLHLRELSDLWTSTWGRYALLKSVLAAVIVGLGAVNWRRLGPRLRHSAGTQSLQRALWGEVALAVAALLVTALLVVTPLPGE